MRTYRTFLFLCHFLHACMRKCFTQAGALRDHSFFMRYGGLVGFEGGPCKKIRLQKGGQPKKYGV